MKIRVEARALFLHGAAFFALVSRTTAFDSNQVGLFSEQAAPLLGPNAGLLWPGAEQPEQATSAQASFLQVEPWASPSGPSPSLSAPASIVQSTGSENPVLNAGPWPGMELLARDPAAQGQTISDQAMEKPAASVAWMPSGPAAATQPKEPCKCAEPAAVPRKSEQPACRISNVDIRQDHASSYGISLAEVNLTYGLGSPVDMPEDARQTSVVLAPVSTTPFMCLDDRLTEPSLSTPGGELGEFISAVASYLQDIGGQPTQEMVDACFLKYLNTLPPERPLIHCTDERAIRHLEMELPEENLDLQHAPSQYNLAVDLLDKLTEPENHGDSTIRLMLKQPDWFQLDPRLTPTVLRSFYTYLWQQNADGSSLAHRMPRGRVQLRVLRGEPSPDGFLEVTSGVLCSQSGLVPLMVPKGVRHSLLISNLDAVSERRQELATFFANLAQVTPKKIDREKFEQRLERRGWLALETTGSRIAAGLPFFTLKYS